MEFIDFHTHAFSDKIAETTVARLQSICGIVPATDGTLSGLASVMAEWGISGAVVHSIATKPSQHLVANNWAASIKSDHIFPFGSVHPDGEDALEELERIKALGLYGVKLHPDYQGFYVDEERLFPLYRKCGELGLPILFHAGVDPVSDTVHCSPARAVTALKAAPDTIMIMAHMGGNQMWDQVEELLAGQYPNLYLDTALAARGMSDEQCLRIIRKQGADKILLGSDCPWDSTADTVAKLRRLGLTTEEERMIFAGNAKGLLGIA